MRDAADRALAIVGVSAILPDAPDVKSFWRNLTEGRYSISEVPPERWDPALYYDPDPSAPEKTYSKIGGWVREGDWEWEPMKWRLPIPPKVAESMDEAQKWSVACARSALLDFGHPERPLDLERTAVVIGTAMAGDRHYWTALPVFFPEYAAALAETPSFSALPEAQRETLARELHERVAARLPAISEDSMPGELANCMAGRIANLFDLHGPNFVCDAACASALAAIDAAHDGLLEGEYDAALVGGVDRNMGPAPFVKFSKIGALSATGTRPYADGADGFVMGEGAAFFLLKRLADAEAAGDRIYAVIRGVAGSSDGRGKGITAPNPAGQRLAVERAWKDAGVSPATATMVEGHGTSTRVGDVVEVETLSSVFGQHGLAPGSIALGSVKSNIGHLKGAAGAAGLLKTVLALHEKQLPPSLSCEHPNPKIDFASSPFYVNTELKPWDTPPDGVRRAGVSAFGFGGTNFHAVLEEYIPGRLAQQSRSGSVGASHSADEVVRVELASPPRGAMLLGEASPDALQRRLEQVLEEAKAGRAPAAAAPEQAALRAPERLAIDYGDAAELASKGARALKAFATSEPAAQSGLWKALRSQGIFRGRGEPAKVAFLYTGQGSQYVNMLREARESEPIVAETLAEADRTMTPLLGRPLSEIIFVDPDDAAAVQQAEAELRRTEITQPAVLTIDAALSRLLSRYGVVPDMVMGHSLGEYGALVSAGALPFAHALEAVSARGREMASLTMDDNGRMAAVIAPLEEIERVIAAVPSSAGELVIANINSTSQAVVGGSSAAVEQAVAAFEAAGHKAVPLSVSHAFHTSIVAPASDPLRRTLERLELSGPAIPLVGNVDGELYPMGPDAPAKMLDLLAAQVSSPVQFVKGLHTLYHLGARIFIEVGPKKALHGFVSDVLGEKDDVLALFTNHPKLGDATSFNHALCGLYASGLGLGREEARSTHAPAAHESAAGTRSQGGSEAAADLAAPAAANAAALTAALPEERYTELGRLFAEFMDRGSRLLGGSTPAHAGEAAVVTGAALGLPGRERVFDDLNVQHILDGEQEIDLIPTRFRHAMVDKHITRLVKSGGGGPHFEAINSSAEVIKLAARAGRLDLEAEFGVSADRIAALDKSTQLAIAAGLEAMRDAGIPLVLRYRTTTTGSRLPDRWMLPEPLRDETGVIFAAAFPGYDAFAEELRRYFEDHSRESQLETLRSLRERATEGGDGAGVLGSEIDRRIHELEEEQSSNAFEFDRRFLFRILAMGHSQFAEFIGARGPNTHVNSACASTTQAFALAQDWIAAGRCRRVVIVAADDVTTDNLLEWIGSGFLATGAAATDDVVEDAAVPFDRRRHGMILGMGAAGIVIESPACARERGHRPICELLSSVTANSAFHGTRLDVEHIGGVMEQLVCQAEQRFGLDRHQIARELLFVSHETYTPARGGSASAEVEALRRVFGDSAQQIVVANTKGLTGHPMGVGIEDVVAIKALETGAVPPVPNYRERDPDLGPLNLSRGGIYPIRYALRLGAGFGSQISMSLLRWAPSPDGSRPAADALGYETRLVDEAAWQGWLREMSGDASPEIEVVQRTLRVVDRGLAARSTASAPHPAASAAVVAAASAAPQTAGATATATGAADGETAAGSASGIEDEVRDRVMAIVAAQTGYPTDMLDLDLDLEADLGIDTVKQAETFAAIREAYGIPRDENLQLREYPTLAHAIRFVLERSPELAGAASASAAVGPASATPEAAAPAASPAGVEDEIRERVLGIVAAQTGYPPDMLDLDLDLEADLGIDTVKQAETFAAIREAYGIPRDENLQLREYPTLAHAIRFVLERSPELTGAASANAATSEDEESSPPALSLHLLEGSMQAADSIPRRVPVAVLRPPLDQCGETGASLGEGARVLVMPDRGGVARALVKRLEKRGVHVLLPEEATEREALAGQIEAWLGEGGIDGVYWLPALDAEGELDRLDLSEWRAGLVGRVKLLHGAAQALYETLDESGRFFVSATRLGGRCGLDGAGTGAPMGGAVSGFTKTLKRERPNALVKVVDFPESRKTAELADALIAETLRDPGAVELGHFEGQRFSTTLRSQPAEDGNEGLALGPESVFVITGAAGSIVSAITADLARGAGGGSFHLLDVAPPPDPADEELALFESDRDGLKRRIFERLRAAGDRGTPAQVERELAGLERAHAAAAAIRAIEQAGGRARYHQVDLTHGEAVGKVVDEIRDADHRIDVLMHAAGMERSRLLPDKTAAEFDLVFDVKCDGWFNLLRAIGDTPLASTVVFCSIAGRFGNAGQSDYSAANDLLCKCSTWLHARRPETRAIAIDWTAWDQIGMASRGSIPDVMAMAGIDMLPPEAGIPVVRRELCAGARSGEVMIAGRLGALEAEWDDRGGLGPSAFTSSERGPMLGDVTRMGLRDGLEVRTRLDPAEQPFLDHHRIDGTSVLPGVMGLEGFAELASLMQPAWCPVAAEGVEFLAPFKFYRDEPREIEICAHFEPEGEEILAHCRLIGRRQLAASPEPQVTEHFRARIRLAREPLSGETEAAAPRSAGLVVAADSIYRIYFHGSAYRVLDRVERQSDDVVGHFTAALPPNHSPAERSLATLPRLLELCFQTAGVWEIGATGRMGLPASIERVEWLGAARTEPGRALARITPRADGRCDATVIDDEGSVLLRMQGYATQALPVPVGSALRRPLEALAGDGGGKG